MKRVSSPGISNIHDCATGFRFPVSLEEAPTFGIMSSPSLESTYFPAQYVNLSDNTLVGEGRLPFA
jgi:hypothetical protein